MELDELKKSWNVLGEHLKDKKFVKDEEISKLIGHANSTISEMSSFNRRSRIASLIIIGFLIAAFVYDSAVPDIYYIIALIAVIPALWWDMYSARYLSNTRIDEMPLITVISRFNRLHRWTIRERLLGVCFMLAMALFFFFYRQVWMEATVKIVFFLILWAIGLIIPLWIYRKNITRLKNIKKNLDELKELKDDF